MKILTLLALAATISLPMCATSCSWNKADWQRLGTKTLDAALSTGTTEAQAIQATKPRGK